MRTLLIVDDQPSVCVALEFLFTGTGYRVLTTTSGLASLALVAAQSIDGALIDVHMPGMNGFDTCTRLQARARECGRALRVWFMTGACTKILETRSAELGALGVLRKPLNFAELLSTFERGFAAPLPSIAPPAGAADGDNRAVP